MTFEPRRAAPGHFRRWAKQSLDLILRAPAAFGLVIAVLLGLQTIFSLHVAFEWAGLIAFGWLLPFCLGAILLLARRADTGTMTLNDIRAAMAPLWRAAVFAEAVWLTVLAVAFVYLMLIHPGTGGSAPPIGRGALPSLAYFTAWITGLYFFVMPLITFQGCGVGLANRLSRRACAIQSGEPWPVFEFSLIGISFLPMLLVDRLHLHPALLSAIMVALGTFSYVAYREVFEGRGTNEPVRSKASVAAARA